MDIFDRIQHLASKSGLTIAGLERATGLSNGIIKKWKTQSPSCDKIVTLANYLNTTTEYILLGKTNEQNYSDDEIQLVAYYKELDEKGKGMVLGRAETLAELAAERAAEQKKSQQEAENEPLHFPAEPEQSDTDDNCYIEICSLPASAGAGVYLDDSSTEPLHIVHTAIADRANYAVRVSGDSMEPRFHDGDIVLVETCPSVEKGEIGIFVVNGEGYIKQYDGRTLLSLNPKRKNIHLNEDDTVYCRGRVLGIAEVVE